MKPQRLALGFLLLLATAAPLAWPAQAQAQERLRETLTVAGVEREYHVRLPRDYDPSREYWLLVIAHNPVRNGQDYWLPRGVRSYADEVGLDAIVAVPSFSRTWGAYPAMGEGDYLKQVIADLRGQYRLREKILLTGYSFGGQVTHRFAFQNPEMVAAAAPLAMGSFSAPDGVLLSQTAGIVEDPVAFLGGRDGADDPEELAQVARAATMPADPDSRAIPFLVMVGTQDPRWEYTQDVVARLRAAGYEVETDWPETPHSCLGADSEACDAEYAAEFDRFARRIVEFFHRVTRE